MPTGPKSAGVILNPVEGGTPAGTGQKGELGEVVSPIAEIALFGYTSGLVGSIINCPWLSSIKYAHSDGFGPPVKNTVSNVPPDVTGKE